MSVIINEFEITPAPPAASPQPAGAAAPAPAPPPPAQSMVRETERIMQRHLERLARVRAY